MLFLNCKARKIEFCDWKLNDRQSQSFCLSFKVIYRSKKPLILDVIVIVIGKSWLISYVWWHSCEPSDTLFLTLSLMTPHSGESALSEEPLDACVSPNTILIRIDFKTHYLTTYIREHITFKAPIETSVHFITSWHF